MIYFIEDEDWFGGERVRMVRLALDPKELDKIKGKHFYDKLLDISGVFCSCHGGHRRVLAQMEGGEKERSALAERFREYEIHEFLYRAAPPLLEFIEQVKADGGEYDGIHHWQWLRLPRPRALSGASPPAVSEGLGGRLARRRGATRGATEDRGDAESR
jgi:hypothetical protein